MARRLLYRLRAVERWLDRTVTGGLAKTFPSPLDLVELESALRADCDAKAAPLSGGRVVAPNEYAITIAPADLRHEDEADVRAHLISALDQHVAASGYSLAGPIALIIRRDGSHPEGLPSIRSAILAAGVHGTPDAPAALVIGTRRVGLPTGDFRIGRDDGMDLRLDDVGISRHHCDISRSSGSLTIHDRHSTNGTIVNGVRVTKATLKHGDVIRLGSTELIVDVSS